MRSRLRSLFERSFGDKITFVSRGKDVPDEQFDFHAPMLTATGLLRQHIDDFRSSNTAYLKPAKHVVDSLRKTMLEASGGKPIIGMSWLSKNKKVGKKRSISAVDLALAIPDDFFLVNLQYGDVSEDVRNIGLMTQKGIAIFDNIDNWDHLDSFAALIAACDKVVSIDNSTVHFAGALGKECHVLLPYSCDWRWGLQEHKDSHWYKSISLHRQTKLNDWSDAIKSLQSALNENSPS